MSKLIYAEPDDEITNLVDRLRSEKTEKELVFVLPGSSRVMHSSLNARLLKQYSNSLGKTTSVISPDSRTQSIAIETGFSVFPTMAAFEAGKSIDRAVGGGSAAGMTPSVLAPLPAAAEGFENVPTPRRSSTSPPPTAPRAVPVATRKPKSDATGISRPGYIPYVLGGVGVFLILLILFLFVLPSATVQVVVQARAISANPQISGSTVAPAAGETATVQTTIQQAQEQMQQANITSTGQKTIPGAPGTGTVMIANKTFFACALIPINTQVSTDSGVKFRTTAVTTPACPGGPAVSAPVSAEQATAAGNVGPGAINHFQMNDTTFTVTNPVATTGGTDPTTKTVVSQADQDGVKKTLGDQLTTKVNADLQKTAGTQKLLPETLVLSVDASFDKKPGDEAPNFNATVTVKASQVSVDDAKVKTVLTNALKKQAPSGYALTDNAPKLAWTLVQHDPNGGIILNGTASGFMATAINKDDIRSHITGKSIAKARAYIQGNIDASNVIIQESPSLIPWLPYIGSRIDVRTTVENTTPG